MESTNTYFYDITTSEEYVEGTGTITTYGINIYNADEKLAMQECEHCRIDNISSEYGKIVDFRQLIEDLKLYPIHLPDVVEDFLA